MMKTFQCLNYGFTAKIIQLKITIIYVPVVALMVISLICVPVVALMVITLICVPVVALMVIVGQPVVTKESKHI